MDNETLINLSALSEFAYCKRRFYLKYLENNFGENYFMVDGTIKHENIHKYNIEKRENIIVVTNLLLYSREDNLIGKSDKVEFILNKNGTYINAFENSYDIVPIEYKRSFKEYDISSKLQLCGQVLCLEKMYNTHIPIGYIYDISKKNNIEVEIDKKLREETINVIQEIKDLYENPKLVKIIKKKRCNKCGVFDKCNPNIDMVNEYVNVLWGELNDTN